MPPSVSTRAIVETVNEIDRQLLSWLYSGRTDGLLYDAMVVLSAVGGGWGLVALTPWLIAARTRRIAGGLLATLLSTTLVVFVIKLLVGRARPCACVPGVHALCFAAPTDPSFPSGHAAGSFAFAAFVITLVAGAKMDSLRRFGLVAAALAFAVGVAASRVVLGVHFPTDVLAGAVLGCAAGWAGARLARRRLEA